MVVCAAATARGLDLGLYWNFLDIMTTLLVALAPRLMAENVVDKRREMLVVESSLPQVSLICGRSGEMTWLYSATPSSHHLVENLSLGILGAVMFLDTHVLHAGCGEWYRWRQ